MYAEYKYLQFIVFYQKLKVNSFVGLELGQFSIWHTCCNNKAIDTDSTGCFAIFFAATILFKALFMVTWCLLVFSDCIEAPDMSLCSINVCTSLFVHSHRWTNCTTILHTPENWVCNCIWWQWWSTISTQHQAPVRTDCEQVSLQWQIPVTNKVTTNTDKPSYHNESQTCITH
jgi:hypothetical protein